MSNAPHRFIVTEPPVGPGLEAERRIWAATRAAFAQEDCLAYWRYPLFSNRGETRKEPDIVLAHPNLGLAIIEVKGLHIDQIVSISGHRWTYRGFYQESGAPYQQAEGQLFTLLGFCDTYPELRRRIPSRALVALPNIERATWESRGFHEIPSCPPVLFKDDLGPATLRERIRAAPLATPATPLDAGQWQRLLSVLGGTPTFVREPAAPPAGARGAAVAAVNARISELDLQQEHIGKQIPPGPQQIRGIAGSGKTVLLCQKAAGMHLKHPDWNIALVFFTRSLYDEITGHVRRWIRRFSNGECDYDPLTSKLRVLHAWGAVDQPGLYGEVCTALGTRRLTARDFPDGSPSDKLARACARLLDENDIPELFDAVLIDEGQDLVVDDPLKWEDKQPIYWLAYRATRPSDPNDTDSRRLIWAYDEAQSLDSLKIPMAKELFGEARTRLTTGSYPGGIQKSEVMRRCYRTPAPVLVAAHALGMGLKRPGGMLSGYTRKEDWEGIGYEVEGEFTARGNPIRLRRPAEYSPNPITAHWNGQLATFKAYASREEELDALAHAIRRDLEEGLRPSRDILVVTLGTNGRDRALRRCVHGVLQAAGIPTYEPSAIRLNDPTPSWPSIDPNQFWYAGGVTVSGVHRAKGNEACSVYVIGLDAVAERENDVALRNHLFVAMSRSRGWVALSGLGDAPLYREIDAVLTETAVPDANGAYSISFAFSRPGREMGDVQLDLFAGDGDKSSPTVFSAPAIP